MKIKNINKYFGEPVEFCGSCLDNCLVEMAQRLILCGNETTFGKSVYDVVNDFVDGIDYEVVE